jgi:hypothetical protein
VGVVGRTTSREYEPAVTGKLQTAHRRLARTTRPPDEAGRLHADKWRAQHRHETATVVAVAVAAVAAVAGSGRTSEGERSGRGRLTAPVELPPSFAPSLSTQSYAGSSTCSSARHDDGKDAHSARHVTEQQTKPRVTHPSRAGSAA